MIANLAGVAALLADGVRALLVLPIRLALTAPRSCRRRAASGGARPIRPARETVIMTQPNDDADEGVYRAATDEEAARVQANADERAATGWWPAS